MSNKNITIMVVDDDADFVSQQKADLESEGFNVITAESQRSAEELLKTARPDVAIVDLVMEYMDSGFSLCHHIKKKNPSIRVILATNVTSVTGIEFDAATPEERSWVKADVMLIKPVRSEQLLREIEHLLKGQ